MSRLHEFRDVLNHVKLAWDRGKQTALVMLTEVVGSAYRLPGTKMMMAMDGAICGTISGGCLEGDLFGWAEQAMKKRRPHIQIYDLNENEIWSLGVGCKGILEFLILPLEATDPFWKKVHEMTSLGRVFSLILEMPTGVRLLIDEEGIAWGDMDQQVPVEVYDYFHKRFERQTRAEVFQSKNKKFVIDVIRPSERLIVAGAGRDAVPVAELAAKAGFDVSILDPRSEFNTSHYFPTATHLVEHPVLMEPSKVDGSWWIIMNHHKDRDEAALDLAIRSNPKFIGVLGPLNRTLDMLAKIGHDLSSGPIHSPIGLDLGAETMDEVAVSIVAELMAIRAKRSASPLNGKVKIHA